MDRRGEMRNRVGWEQKPDEGGAPSPLAPRKWLWKFVLFEGSHMGSPGTPETTDVDKMLGIGVQRGPPECGNHPISYLSKELGNQQEG